ncbi:unnamed protein product [Penicillium olsonii]|uniref:ER-bound oxygenase mpaB/mpaB'/Rubber oxygenase catalytic domain-containing protein n=1 Tax=Penicillium olsonii TaxID=99116 RepID=A0A9W4IAU4_PENOL|nr:unnamed protein product [Penicillium olsonii]CAG8272870.1 unnamed protein product [Penicillium olsonii]
MSSISPVSTVDEKQFGALPVTNAEAAPSHSDSGRLHALEQLEIIPKMLQEGIIFAGAGAALLLQAALPGIRDGTTGGPKELATELIEVMQCHISYISCLVFGTRAERKTLLDLLQSGERPLLGDGHSARFTAHPPQQLWMAATLYVTTTDVYQRVYGRVDYATAQRAYSEFTLLMYCLGVPSGTWPASREEFWSYWDDQVSQLTVSSDAAEFAKDLRESTEMPRWVQSMKPFLRVAMIEMLPPQLRDAYGLRSTVSTRTLYRTYMGLSVAVYPAMPRKWRAYPYRFYQDRLKKQLNVI